MRNFIFRYLFFTVFFLLMLNCSPAAESGQLRERRTKLSLGTSLSTSGAGVSFAVSLSDPLLVRLGVEYLAFQYPFTFEENDISYAADLSFRTGNVSLIGDYYYYRSLYHFGRCGIQPVPAGC
jgi:hypothetical protein